MSKNNNELLVRERLEGTGGSMRTNETAQTTRVLWEHELDAVSGGFIKYNFTDVLVESFSLGTSNTFIVG